MCASGFRNAENFSIGKSFSKIKLSKKKTNYSNILDIKWLQSSPWTQGVFPGPKENYTKVLHKS